MGVWQLKVREVTTAAGFPKGKYRLTAVPESGVPVDLCQHEHLADANAWRCKKARTAGRRYVLPQPKLWRVLRRGG